MSDTFDISGASLGNDVTADPNVTQSFDPNFTGSGNMFDTSGMLPGGASPFDPSTMAGLPFSGTDPSSGMPFATQTPYEQQQNINVGNQLPADTSGTNQGRGGTDGTNRAMQQTMPQWFQNLSRQFSNPLVSSANAQNLTIGGGTGATPNQMLSQQMQRTPDTFEQRWQQDMRDAGISNPNLPRPSAPAATGATRSIAPAPPPEQPLGAGGYQVPNDTVSAGILQQLPPEVPQSAPAADRSLPPGVTTGSPSSITDQPARPDMTPQMVDPAGAPTGPAPDPTAAPPAPDASPGGLIRPDIRSPPSAAPGRAPDAGEPPTDDTGGATRQPGGRTGGGQQDPIQQALQRLFGLSPNLANLAARAIRQGMLGGGQRGGFPGFFGRMPGFRGGFPGGGFRGGFPGGGFRGHGGFPGRFGGRGGFRGGFPGGFPGRGVPPWMRGRPDMFGGRGGQGMPQGWNDWNADQAGNQPDQAPDTTQPDTPSPSAADAAPDYAQQAETEPPRWPLNPQTGQPLRPGETAQRFPGTGVRSQVANNLADAGLSDNAIAGVMQNIRDESGFRSGVSGDASQSRGLYQFNQGGQWPNYVRWLRNQGRSDWQNPALQTRFVTDWLKNNKPQAWRAMNAARTPGEAAQIFLRAFENPAPHYLASRASRYAHGVPELASWLR